MSVNCPLVKNFRCASFNTIITLEYTPRKMLKKKIIYKLITQLKMNSPRLPVKDSFATKFSCESLETLCAFSVDRKNLQKKAL